MGLLTQSLAISWLIYPLGYYLVYLGPAFAYHSQSVVNIIYNLADFVNKITFGLIIWYAASTDKRIGEEPKPQKFGVKDFTSRNSPSLGWLPLLP